MNEHANQALLESGLPVAFGPAGREGEQQEGRGLASTHLGRAPQDSVCGSRRHRHGELQRGRVVQGLLGSWGALPVPLWPQHLSRGLAELGAKHLEQRRRLFRRNSEWGTEELLQPAVPTPGPSPGFPRRWRTSPS